MLGQSSGRGVISVAHHHRQKLRRGLSGKMGEGALCGVVVTRTPGAVWELGRLPPSTHCPGAMLGLWLWL